MTEAGSGVCVLRGILFQRNTDRTRGEPRRDPAEDPGSFKGCPPRPTVQHRQCPERLFIWPGRDRLHVLIEATHPYPRATRVGLLDFGAPVKVCQAIPVCTGVALLAPQVTPTPCRSQPCTPDGVTSAPGPIEEHPSLVTMTPSNRQPALAMRVTLWIPTRRLLNSARAMVTTATSWFGARNKHSQHKAGMDRTPGLAMRGGRVESTLLSLIHI